jgi:hypothetical protein
MKHSLVCLVLMVLAGCGQSAVPSKAERVDDSKVHEWIGNQWGNRGNQYAPHHYAGFAYDSTGVYGNLHGGTEKFLNQPPDVVAVAFIASKQVTSASPPSRQLIARRDIYLFGRELMPVPEVAGYTPAASAPGLSDNQFKWLDKGDMVVTKRATSYNRTFWISWQAIGLDGPAADGELQIFVSALVRQEPAGSFVIGDGK